MKRIPLCLGLVCMLAGCLPGDAVRVSECMASLAAVEPDGQHLDVTPNATEIDRVSLDYRRLGDDDNHWIVCKYDSPWWGFGGSELAGVVVDGTALGPGRLTFLKTHWIGTSGAAQDVAARLTAQG